ncbi:MAG: hypothetical protein ACLTQI_04040 [Slackia sp.]
MGKLIVGVGLTTGNTHELLHAAHRKPHQLRRLAMVLSMAIVPLVSLVINRP